MFRLARRLLASLLREWETQFSEHLTDLTERQLMKG